MSYQKEKIMNAPLARAGRFWSPAFTLFQLVIVLLVGVVPYGTREAEAGNGLSRETLTPIHMFWAGNAVEPAAFDNIVAWGDKANANDSKYSLTLWTTKETVVKLAASGQLQQLNQQGVVVRTDTRDQISTKMREYYDAAIRTNSYALASDIARYGIMEKQGGVYADVDFRPGSVDLSIPPPRMGKGDIPFFAPKVRYSNDWDAAKYNLGEELTDAKTAVKLYNQGLNNNFIIAPKGSKFFEELNRKIKEHMEAEKTAQGGTITETINTNKAGGISGPTTVTETIIQRTRNTAAGAPGAGAAASLARNPYDTAATNWINMQWITDASNKQANDHNTSSDPVPSPQPGNKASGEHDRSKDPGGPSNPPNTDEDCG